MVRLTIHVPYNAGRPLGLQVKLVDASFDELVGACGSFAILRGARPSIQVVAAERGVVADVDGVTVGSPSELGGVE